WNVTEQRLTNVLQFLMRLQPARLAEAPGGSNYLTRDLNVLERGRIVFAENCAECHSSKRPPQDADSVAWFRAEASRGDFWKNNALSQYIDDATVKGRIEAFNDAIEKLLWPERRLGIIWKTKRESFVKIDKSVIPAAARRRFKKSIDADGVLRIGPIPAGVP